jgi:hypothetical protein
MLPVLSLCYKVSITVPLNKEMLMHRVHSPHPSMQLALFPPPLRPAWQTLPAEVRQMATTLLAMLLRQHYMSSHDGAKEVDND